MNVTEDVPASSEYKEGYFRIFPGIYIFKNNSIKYYDSLLRSETEAYDNYRRMWCVQGRKLSGTDLEIIREHKDSIKKLRRIFCQKIHHRSYALTRYKKYKPRKNKNGRRS